MITHQFLLCKLLLFPNKRVILYRETVNTGTYASAITIFFILFYSIILMNNNRWIFSFFNIVKFMKIWIFRNMSFIFISFIFRIDRWDFFEPQIKQRFSQVLIQVARLFSDNNIVHTVQTIA